MSLACGRVLTLTPDLIVIWHYVCQITASPVPSWRSGLPGWRPDGRVCRCGALRSQSDLRQFEERIKKPFHPASEYGFPCPELALGVPRAGGLTAESAGAEPCGPSGARRPQRGGSVGSVGSFPESEVLSSESGRGWRAAGSCRRFHHARQKLPCRRKRNRKSGGHRAVNAG